MILKHLAEFREAIGEDSLRCLYCESLCDCATNTTVDQNTFNTVEINKCKNCQEKFIFYYFLLDTLTGCTFTCNDICVYVSAEGCSLKLAGAHTDANIPLTEFDFSNKEAIYKKLKTYLLFS
jgi:hypothetical protein